MCLSTNMIGFASWLPFPLETLLGVTYWLGNLMWVKARNPVCMQNNNLAVYSGTCYITD